MLHFKLHKGQLTQQRRKMFLSRGAGLENICAKRISAG